MISYILIVLFPLASLIMVLIKKGDCAEDTVLSSHVSNQLRIMVWAIIWSVILFVASVVLGIVIPFIGSALGMIFFLALGIWVLYRVIKGASRLSSNQVA